jgi:hypothetical protein
MYTKTKAMKIADYKAGDEVEVKVNNPANENKEEWRDARVIDKRTIYPSNGSHHPPYPILIVTLKRTYCKATPVYRFIGGNIPVFVDNNLEFYDKENDEGIIYESQIRMKTVTIPV